MQMKQGAEKKSSISNIIKQHTNFSKAKLSP